MSRVVMHPEVYRAITQQATEFVARWDGSAIWRFLMCLIWRVTEEDVEMQRYLASLADERRET